MEDNIILLNGGLAVDDRGQVSFVNDFHFENVKRFYMVSNHKQGFILAWHGHKNESKYVSVVSGVALVGAVHIDNWDSPSNDTKPERYILSENKPQILYIPKGYANGFMSLTKDTKIIFYSTSALEDSLNDDFRFDSRHWDIWNIIER